MVFPGGGMEAGTLALELVCKGSFLAAAIVGAGGRERDTEMVSSDSREREMG